MLLRLSIGFFPFICFIGAGWFVCKIQGDRDGTAKATEALWGAVKENDPEAAKGAILRGADLENREHTWNRTALHEAAERGHSEVLEVLLEAGADVEAEDYQGNRPLHLAAYFGREAALARLIGAGADLQARGYTGASPLHCAAHEGHLGAVEVLLGAGADPEAANDNGNRPLHLAAYTARDGVLRRLVEAGADIHAGGWAGMTALDWAARFGKESTVALLTSLGARQKGKQIGNGMQRDEGLTHAGALKFSRLPLVT